VRASDPSSARRLVLASIAELGNEPGRHGDATLAQAAYVVHLLVDRQGMPVGMEVGPNQTWLHLTLAWAIYLQGNRGSFVTAEALADVLLDAAGDSRASGDALNWLAAAYREQGKPADAIRVYNRLVEECPTHRMVDRALLAMGELQSETGAYEDAVASWRRMIALHPDARTVGTAWFNMGELYERLGDAERAREAYAGGASSRPAEFMAHRCADRLAAMGDPRANATQNLRLAGASSYLRPLPIEVPRDGDLAAVLRSDERYLRLKFFGEIGVPEGEWEALDLAISPPTLDWQRAVFPALAETGFAHSASQLADAHGWGRVGGRITADRFRLDLPFIQWRHVRALADEMDIDPYLVLAVARQESTFRPALRSHAGASGMMQVMPRTASWLAEVDGRVHPEHADHLMDPYSSLRMGAVYIRRMLNFWDGDVVKALASYNAGPGNVRKWVNRNPGQSTHDFIESIPFSETKDYVKRVTANYAGYYTLHGPPP
jgi:soluble lytic murein transglycosylase